MRVTVIGNNNLKKIKIKSLVQGCSVADPQQTP